MNQTLEIRGLKEHEAKTTATMERYNTMCAWCGKSKDESGRWYHSHISTSEMTTHGICPGCLNVMKEELNRYRSLHLAASPQPA